VQLDDKASLSYPTLVSILTHPLEQVQLLMAHCIAEINIVSILTHPSRQVQLDKSRRSRYPGAVSILTHPSGLVQPVATRGKVIKILFQSSPTR